MSRRRGQSILYVILLMPAVLLILCMTVEVGQLQFQRLRLRNATDLATLSGATSVDRTYYAGTGLLRLDPALAVATTRDYLKRNLLEALGAEQAAAVADAAEIAVVNVPGKDPFTGVLLDRPSVSTRIKVRYRLSLLAFVGTVWQGTMSLASTSQIRP